MERIRHSEMVEIKSRVSRMIWTIICEIDIIILMWVFFSVIEVVQYNLDPIPSYSWWNCFDLFVKYLI